MLVEELNASIAQLELIKFPAVSQPVCPASLVHRTMVWVRLAALSALLVLSLLSTALSLALIVQSVNQLSRLVRHVAMFAISVNLILLRLNLSVSPARLENSPMTPR